MDETNVGAAVFKVSMGEVMSLICVYVDLIFKVANCIKLAIYDAELKIPNYLILHFEPTCQHDFVEG